MVRSGTAIGHDFTRGSHTTCVKFALYGLFLQMGSNETLYSNASYTCLTSLKILEPSFKSLYDVKRVFPIVC